MEFEANNFDGTGVKYLFNPPRCADENCITCTPRSVYLYNIYHERSAESAVHQRLWTRIDKLKTVTDTEVIHSCLCGVVVQMSEIREADENIPAVRVKAAIADSTGVINMFISDRREVKFAVGQTVIVSNFVLRQGSIQVTERSRITRRNPLAVTDAQKTAALVQFSTPFFPVMAIRTAVQQQQEYKVSVQGVVTDVGFMSVYRDSNGNMRYKRFIRLHEGKDFILLLMHSSAAAHCDDQLGDFVVALDVKTMWCPVIRRAIVVAVFEDQIKVQREEPLEGEFVILSIRRSGIRDLLWATVQGSKGIRQLYLELSTMSQALGVVDVPPEHFHQYLPITASGSFAGSIVQSLNIVRHKQLKPTVFDSDGLSPTESDFPVTVAENIEWQFTVESAIDQEEGYYLSDISDN